MRESMPDTHGWVDRGPSRHPKPKAGPVRITRPDGTEETMPAYKSISAIIHKSIENPRKLSPAERDIAFGNQVIADEDLAAMEKWYADGATVPEGGR